MSQGKELLIAARKLIEKPENWTQGSYARDTRGRPASVQSISSTCFCALGACHRARRDGDYDRSVQLYATDALSQAAKDLFDTGSIVTINDQDTLPREEVHADVLQMFDLAIERAP